MKKAKVKKFVPFLKIIHALNDKDKTEILKHIDNDAVECISCVIRNALSNKSLSKKNQIHLRKHLLSKKNDLRYIANGKKPAKLRKRRINQMGGSVIAAVVSTLLPLITSLFQK